MSYRRGRRKERNCHENIQYKYNLSARRRHSFIDNASNAGRTDTKATWRLLFLGSFY